MLSSLRMILIAFLVSLPAAGFCNTENSADTEPSPGIRVFSTWGGFLEADRCAAAWAIRRFVEPDARFRIHPPQTMQMEGTAFDVPLPGPYARQPKMTMLDTILAAHKVQDPAALRLAAVIRDIELNRWAEKKTPEAPGIEAVIRGLNRVARDEQDCLEKSFVIFESLYEDFKGPQK